MIQHPELKAGDHCPSCSQAKLTGKVYPIHPGVVIRLEGQPLVTGIRYELEKFRCHLCGERYTAPAPEVLFNSEKYDPTARSAVAMGRYYLGLPFKRIEMWQAAQGIPLADATQWDQIVKLYKIVNPVHYILECLAAEGDVFQYDDTGNTILSESSKLINSKQEKIAKQNGNEKNEKKKGRNAHTTAIISTVNSHNIYLFYTSEYCASKNIGDLLLNRETDALFFTMTDASQNNMPRKVKEALLVRWIMCFCLVHGRRKFYELYDFFPQEVDFVLDQIAKVYEHEAYCKKYQLTPEEQLIYHQEHSAPVMQALWTWFNNQLFYRTVEANSGLGRAIRYMIRHWHKLTRFLHVAGSPIDNSWCERTIKIAIRHRRNSLFFKTPKGAHVGDCLMSLIHTAIQAKINPFEYLTTLQHYKKQVAEDPQLWLPWNYQETLQQYSPTQQSTIAA